MGGSEDEEAVNRYASEGDDPQGKAQPGSSGHGNGESRGTSTASRWRGLGKAANALLSKYSLHTRAEDGTAGDAQGRGDGSRPVQCQVSARCVLAAQLFICHRRPSFLRPGASRATPLLIPPGCAHGRSLRGLRLVLLRRCQDAL